MVPRKARGTPASELLCLAAAPSADQARTQTVLDSAPDWNEVTRLAADHGLRPALIELLSAVAWKHVPDPVRQELEEFQSRHLLRMLEVAEELAQAARDFIAHGIPFAHFKGPALSTQLYRQLAAREFNDVDLIVPPRHAERAERVLAERGYRPAFADPRFRRFFQGYQGQCAFRRPGSTASLDLHWSFSGSFLPFPLRGDEIWHRLTNVSIAGVEVPTLQPDDVALLLAGHGTKEGWRSLMWLRDFAFVVVRWPELDWIAIHRRAARNGCGDAVLLACALAERILAVPVPMALVPILAAGARVGPLTASLADRLCSGSGDRRHLGDLALCDRFRDRLGAGLGFALSPTPGDFGALPLPRPLWPAYYLLRPVRLASKALRGTLPLP